jgi:hypothetical protein
MWVNEDLWVPPPRRPERFTIRDLMRRIDSLPHPFT